VEEDEHGVDLLCRQVDLLQHVVKVLGQQITPLASLGEQLVHFLDRQLARLARLAAVRKITHVSAILRGIANHYVCQCALRPPPRAYQRLHPSARRGSRMMLAL
jgi:hypothetical protein